MFARACLCRCAGKAQWFGTARGLLPEGNRFFQFASCSVAGDVLTVRLQNADVVSKDVMTAGDLATAISANADNPCLFRDAMAFHRSDHD